MKAKELMIGDWVCYCKANNWLTKVEAVNNPGQTYISDVYGIKCCRAKDDPLCKKAPIDFFNVEILHPIPLTKEILEANGFEYSPYADGIWSCRFEDERYLWRFDCTRDRDDDHWLFFVNDNIIVGAFYYVHQLQHALRLCGIDKEIIIKEATL